ncbi:MAG: hypothetical protein JW944_01010 [Deltaproteobacteria bacterium]|nr:hypothetical protein [Deltaproteobacteria bacterium]
MINIKTSKELKEAICLLEEKQDLQVKLLKNSLLSVSEELKPSNIMKNIFSKVTASPDLRGGIITTAIGLSAFYLTRKTLWRSGRNPLRKILSSILQLGLSNVIAGNPKAIKAISHAVFDGIFHKKEETRP